MSAYNPFPFNAPFLNEDDTVAQERFNPEATHTWAHGLWTNSEQRRRVWADIELEYDAEPPYNEDELREMNRGYVSNFSSRLLESDIDMHVASYITRLTSQEKQAVLPLRRNTKLPEGMGLESAQMLLEQVFNEACRMWEEKSYTDSLVLFDQAKFGLGIYMSQGLHDWRDKHIELKNFLIDDYAPLDEKLWDACAVVDFIGVDTLVDIVLQEDRAIKQGWNPAGIASYLIQSTSPINSISQRNEVFSSWSDVTRIVQDIRTKSMHRIDGSSPSFTLPVIRVFIKEYVSGGPERYDFLNGKYRSSSEGKNRISQYIIPFNANRDGINTVIYRKRFCYECFSDIFTVCSYMPHKYLWGVKGIGQRSHTFATQHSRIMCGLADSALAALSVKYIPESMESLARLQELSDSDILPPGTNTLNTSFIAQNMQVSRQFMIDMTQQKVLNMRQPLTTAPGLVSPYETATAAQLRVARERGNLTQQELLFWISQDRRMKRIIKSLAKMIEYHTESHYLGEEIGCKEIIEEILERMDEVNLPKKLFSDVNLYRVTCGKTIGRGSAEEQIVASQIIERFRAYLSPEAQRSLARGVITTLYGPDKSLELMPIIPEPTRNEKEQMRLATQENGIMRSGTVPMLLDTDMDEIHIGIHLEDWKQVWESLKTRIMSPMDGWRALLAFQAHLYGPSGHIERALSRVTDDSNELRSLQAVFGQDAQALTNAIQETQKAVEEEIATAQFDPIKEAQYQNLLARTQSVMLTNEKKMFDMQRLPVKDNITNNMLIAQTEAIRRNAAM